MTSRSIAAVVAAAGLGAAVLGATGVAGAAPTPGLPIMTAALGPTSISVGGQPQSGAVDISASTSSKAAVLGLFRLNPGVTPDQLSAAFTRKFLSNPNRIARYAFLALDAPVTTGATDVQTILEPGTYVAVNAVGNDPAKWPKTSFSVGQASAPALLPTVPDRVRAVDFRFRGPSELHTRQPLQIENSGRVHEVAAIRAPSKTVARQIARLLHQGEDGRAQRLATGFDSFSGPVAGGAVQQRTLTARPGFYVLACFMDSHGREHTQLGMERVIRVVK